LPGIAGNRVFEVMIATNAVFRRLALKELARITNTGRRFPGLLRSGFPIRGSASSPERPQTSVKFATGGIIWRSVNSAARVI
jgi:hypothetical protein